ncbi:hypothetical protein ONE63_005156 [Megalurothrips usitatus]|uniref:C2H2-type domain-containing protein n=1 Tax=Megalurothrips usitatus TaxID=439358 RepID=A0AAV7XUG6_9NEOP|nr:hypothetical protein ONE63_005156 [Megalurothrips usitatus]
MPPTRRPPTEEQRERRRERERRRRAQRRELGRVDVPHSPNEATEDDNGCPKVLLAEPLVDESLFAGDVEPAEGLEDPLAIPAVPETAPTAPARSPRRRTPRTGVLRTKRRRTDASPLPECDLCKKAFWEEADFASHMRLHESSEPVTCNLCPVKFTCKWTLARHLAKHAVDGKAPPCEVPLPRAAETPVHKVMLADPFACASCPRTFPTKAGLAVHTREHADGVFACDLCHKKYLTEWTWRAHLRRHETTSRRRAREAHAGSAAGEATGGTTGEATRAAAGKAAGEVAGEAAGPGRSGGEGDSGAEPLRADTPGASPLFDAVLIKEECPIKLEQDAEDGGVSPGGCAAGCADSCGPVVDPRLACAWCPRTFPSAESLALHTSSQHPDSRFQCPQCPMAFVREPWLAAHMALHDDGGPCGWGPAPAGGGGDNVGGRSHDGGDGGDPLGGGLRVKEEPVSGESEDEGKEGEGGRLGEALCVPVDPRAVCVKQEEAGQDAAAAHHVPLHDAWLGAGPGVQLEPA